MGIPEGRVRSMGGSHMSRENNGTDYFNGTRLNISKFKFND